MASSEPPMAGGAAHGAGVGLIWADPRSDLGQLGVLWGRCVGLASLIGFGVGLGSIRPTGRSDTLEQSLATRAETCFNFLSDAAIEGGSSSVRGSNAGSVRDFSKRRSTRRWKRCRLVSSGASRGPRRPTAGVFGQICCSPRRSGCPSFYQETPDPTRDSLCTSAMQATMPHRTSTPPCHSNPTNMYGAGSHVPLYWAVLLRCCRRSRYYTRLGLRMELLALY